MATPEEQPLKDDKLVKKRKSFKEKLIELRDYLTLEPTLAGYVVPNVLSKLAIQNLNLDKACRARLQYGDEICDALVSQSSQNGSLYQAEEMAVQELIASIETWKNFINTAIPSFLILFIGGWSDKTGRRKILILLPIFGDLLMCLSSIVNVLFFYELPLEMMMFFEAFFPAITGGLTFIYTGAFSYISDVSDEQSRTVRVGIANMCLAAGRPIGSALSGLLLNWAGYYGVFAISAFFYIFSIVYGYIYIKDVRRNESDKEPKGVMAFLKSFFDFRHVKDTLVVAFKKGPNKRRIKSILVLVAVVLLYGPLYGEMAVRYLYSRRRYNWDAVMYSFYSTVEIVAQFIGAVISISVFSKRLGWDDSVLGFISSVSKLAGNLGTALAKNTRDMYIALFIETFNATPFTALRSISSKLVSSDEAGKMVSAFNLIETVTSMVFGPLYSWIYRQTLHEQPSVVFFVSSVLTIGPILIFMWFFYVHRKYQKNLKKAKEESEKDPQTNIELKNNTNETDKNDLTA